jgi:multiple sugar transport system ATP-binding protein
MTVAQNLGFALRMAGRPAAEVDAAVGRAAEILQLSALLDRKPKALSGGQRQRVAIGRAIVREPRVFLFDEPLSNLDAELRVQMRAELMDLHNRLGTTMIYVTHDQVEAMTLADRIVLLRDGRIEQQGSPLELFERPATGFVASFLGSPSINLIPATLVRRDKAVAVQLESGEVLELPDARAGDLEGYIESAITFAIRPQHLSRAGRGTAPSGSARVTATADLIQPTGTRTYVTSRIGGVPVTAELDAHDVHEQGIALDYAIDMSRCLLIDPATDKVI